MEQSVAVLFSDARLELFDLRGRHLARLFSRPSTVRRTHAHRLYFYMAARVRISQLPPE